MSSRSKPHQVDHHDLIAQRTVLVEKFHINGGMTNKTFKEIFSKFGSVEDLIMNQEDSRTRVVFYSRTAAEKVIRDGVKFNNHTLNVRLAVPVIPVSKRLSKETLDNTSDRQRNTKRSRSRSPNSKYKDRHNSSSSRSYRSSHDKDREHSRHSREKEKDSRKYEIFSKDESHDKIVLPPYDVAIIALSHDLISYAQLIRGKINELTNVVGISPLLRSLSVHIIVLKQIEHVNLCLEDLTSNKVYFAVIINELNMTHSSCTVRTLHTPPQQEHRNMPLSDAIVFLRKNFDELLISKPALAYKLNESVPPKLVDSSHTKHEKELVPHDPYFDDCSDKTPPQLINLFKLLAESRFLSLGELDQVLDYIELRRIKLGGSRRIRDSRELNTNQNDNDELQSKILDMLYPRKLKESATPVSLNVQEAVKNTLDNPDVINAVNNLLAVSNPADKYSPFVHQNLIPADFPAHLYGGDSVYSEAGVKNLQNPNKHPHYNAHNPLTQIVIRPPVPVRQSSPIKAHKLSQENQSTQNTYTSQEQNDKSISGYDTHPEHVKIKSQPPSLLSHQQRSTIRYNNPSSSSNKQQGNMSSLDNEFPYYSQPIGLVNPPINSMHQTNPVNLYQCQTSLNMMPQSQQFYNINYTNPAPPINKYSYVTQRTHYQQMF